MDLPFLVLRLPLPERRWREHSDVPKGIEDQEILIASDNRSALASQGGRQHHIVVAIATGWGIECVWRHDGEGLREQPKGAPHINIALAELSTEDVAKVVQQRLRRNDDVATRSSSRRTAWGRLMVTVSLMMY